MKRRYKIAIGILVFFALILSVLALVVSHNSACDPAPSVASGPDTMKAVVYSCYGAPDVLELVDVAKPLPQDDEVLVKIRAASVNPLDWHYMRGSPYIMRLESGIGKPGDTRLGVDFAGIVETVGKDVKTFQPGDAVFGGHTGAFAEFVAVRESRAVVRKPDNISFEQAAAIPIAAVTALQALRDSGKLQQGQKVLINGASGGVGTFAVQIAKSMGAEVTGVCSTRNVEMVRSIGADYVVDYTKENYTQSDKRYDLIVDNVGNHSLSANRKVLSSDGALVLVGGPKGNWLGPMMGPLKALFLSPFVDQEMGMMLAQFRQSDLEVLADLMRSGNVTPVIDRYYSLDQIADAIEYSESGRAQGKIVITVSQETQ